MNVNTYLCYFIEMKAWAIDKCLHLSINEIYIYSKCLTHFIHILKVFLGG